MHPTTGYYQLSHDHLAELRHQAQCTALARAARQPRQALAVPGPLHHSPTLTHTRHVRARHRAQFSGHAPSPGR
jgi:hypothetical protein